MSTIAWHSLLNISETVRNNAEKSVAMRIGTRHNVMRASQTSRQGYLGVFLVSTKHFKGTVNHSKVKFYRVFNCLYSRSKAAHSELVTVELIKSYCLPLILYTVTYATEVMPLSATNVRVLENCINRALYKIFWYWWCKLYITDEDLPWSVKYIQFNRG